MIIQSTHFSNERFNFADVGDIHTDIYLHWTSWNDTSLCHLVFCLLALFGKYDSNYFPHFQITTNRCECHCFYHEIYHKILYQHCQFKNNCVLTFAQLTPARRAMQLLYCIEFFGLFFVQIHTCMPFFCKYVENILNCRLFTIISHIGCFK